jgi:hypothetical protein
MAVKKTVKKAEIVEADAPDLMPALVDGTAIGSFVANLRQFFAQAQLIEMDANATLARMQGLRLPTNAAEDEQVMNEVRAITQKKKVADEHWAVTQLFSRMHKWTVARRERAGRPLDEAAAIGNRLHTTYKDAEVRRAREEQLRLQREAEEKARREQERQLAELEKAALKAEAASPDLSEREQSFISLYLQHRNGPSAARLAGFKDADAAALRLLKAPKILKALEAAEKAIALRKQAVAIKTSPIEVEDVVVKPDIAGGGDRTTWSCEIIDVAAFRDAVFEGKYGIPRDTLIPSPTTLNQYARDMKHLLDRWPGVRAVKKTTVV